MLEGCFFLQSQIGMIGMEDIQSRALMNQIGSRINDYGIMLAEKTTFKHQDTDDVIDDRLQRVIAFKTISAYFLCSDLHFTEHFNLISTTHS